MAEPQVSLSPPPGAFNAEPMAPIYVDGAPLDSLVDALDRNHEILNAQRLESAGQFWSTPPRADHDDTREVFEVRLNAVKKINSISLEVPHFPHRSYVFYQDHRTKEWKPVITHEHRQFIIRMNYSFPAVISPHPRGFRPAPHPQHYGYGHWTGPRHQKIKPIRTSAFRVIQVRHRSDKTPRNPRGKKVPYSLGVRRFDIGYRVTGKRDVPQGARHPVVITERDTFTTTTDMLGSQVAVSVRENRASDLRRGALWRCEPQPIPQAVVNLYVDARDEYGDAQVIDRFTLDPITTGVHLNLYYSADEQDPDHFAASDNPLGFPLTRSAGAEAVRSTATGLRFPAGIGYVDIDNQAVQFDNRKPFWAGLVFAPQFPSTEVQRHVLLDNGALRLEWDGTALAVTLGDATVLVSDLTFERNQQLTLVVGFDGTYLSVYDGTTELTQAVVDNPRGRAPKTSTGMKTPIRLGGLLVGDDQDPGWGDFRLEALVLKREVPPGAATYDAFFASPSDYLVEAEFVDDDQHTADNSLLRYAPFFATAGEESVNPLGFVGGPGNQYEDLTWTPISRDYKLHQGTIVFPPVTARFFKFEFTHLSPQPYDDFAPITRKVRVFPSATYHPVPSVSASGNTAGGGAKVSIQAATTPQYADQVRLWTNVPSPQDVGTYRPTEAYFSNDPLTQLRLRGRSLYYSLFQWHHPRSAPRFVDVTKHVYQHVEISHTQRIGYFVGLKSLQMHRLDYAVDDDTEQYLETFADTTNLARTEEGLVDSGWNIGEGFLSSPEEMGLGQVVATSKTFASRRKVTAIQFATQQTPPVQLLPDADFEDTALVNWRAYGDTTLTPSEEFTTDIGTMVQVDRNAEANFWGTIEARYETWDAIENSDPDPRYPTWDDIEIVENGVPFGGIETAEPVIVSDTGRLYAAARVYAPEALGAPLYVQIVGEDGSIISSEAIEVGAGQVAEWYTSYTVGEGGEEVLLTWDQIEDGWPTPDNDTSIPTWDDLEEKGAWNQIDVSAATLVGPVTARIVQADPTTDTFFVDNLSLYDDAIVWEFSNDDGQNWYPVYDIRNDPQGVFTFPDEVYDEHDTTAGRALRWRVSANRGGQRISSLAIRPWYDSLSSSVPHRETIQGGGPNQALIDHYPPIEDDPHWKVWHKPIPEEWWFTFRQWALQQGVVFEPDKTRIVAPDSIVPVDEGAPSAPQAIRLYLRSDVVVVPTA